MSDQAPLAPIEGVHFLPAGNGLYVITVDGIRVPNLFASDVDQPRVTLTLACEGPGQAIVTDRTTARMLILWAANAQAVGAGYSHFGVGGWVVNHYAERHGPQPAPPPGLPPAEEVEAEHIPAAQAIPMPSERPRRRPRPH